LKLGVGSYNNMSSIGNLGLSCELIMVRHFKQEKKLQYIPKAIDKEKGTIMGTSQSLVRWWNSTKVLQARRIRSRKMKDITLEGYHE